MTAASPIQHRHPPDHAENSPSLSSWEQAGEEPELDQLDGPSQMSGARSLSDFEDPSWKNFSHPEPSEQFVMSQSEFEAMSLSHKHLDSAWSSLDVADIKLPWEQGVWSSIFGDDNRLNFQEPRFERPDVFHFGERSETEPMPRVVAKQKTTHKSWHFLVSNVDVLSWKEAHDAKLETALKRWHDVIDAMSPDYEVVKQFKALPSVSAKLRMVKDLFSLRSPLTLLKRVNSLQFYINSLEADGKIFPADEASLYTFMCEQRDFGAPPSRLQALVESIRFVNYVLGADGLEEELLSKRCLGAAAQISQGPKRQASPLKVTELTALHKCLADNEADEWDRLFCGAALFAVYSRSRWNDLQHSAELLADMLFGRPQYLEGRILHHKTRRANTWSGGVLNAVAPAYGVLQYNWVAQWITVREAIFGSFDLEYPIMPSPNASGEPTKRPLSTSEVGLWLDMVLDRAGLDKSDRRRTSHSFKVTMLSHLAKYGASVTDRELLGGHSSHLKSVLTYSRDSLAGPLRTLEKLLDDVRKGRFCPDQSRSGRFTKRVKLELQETDQQQGGIGSEKTSVEEVSSDSDASGATSSDSQEDDAVESKSGRLVKPPSPPDGTKLMQHAKSKCVHLMSLGNEAILMCGRACNDHYEPPSLMRWDTPCCGRCWKHGRQQQT